jgi:hypothetical protein
VHAARAALRRVPVDTPLRRSRARGARQELPVRSRPTRCAASTPWRDFLERHDRVLAVQRPQRGLLGGLWELPGGELATARRPRARSRARCARASASPSATPSRSATIEHAFTHRLLRVHVYRGRRARGACGARAGTHTAGCRARRSPRCRWGTHAQGARARIGERRAIQEDDGRLEARLLWHGMFMFLLGSAHRLAEPQFANTRMGLAAHLEGVMNGTFVLALGAVWPRYRSPRP